MSGIYVIAGALIGAGLARVDAAEQGWAVAIGIGVLVAAVTASAFDRERT
jgi:hypothetical protein